MDHQVFKERRERLGSQRSVAAELGIGESTIQSYENARSEIPRTVELALEALEKRAASGETTAREHFRDAARRYAASFASGQEAETAYIWTTELGPAIEKMTLRHGAVAGADMLAIVREEKRAASRALRVYDAALKNKGHLINAHKMASGLNKSGLGEILEELG